MYWPSNVKSECLCTDIPQEISNQVVKAFKRNKTAVGCGDTAENRPFAALWSSSGTSDVEDARHTWAQWDRSRPWILVARCQEEASRIVDIKPSLQSSVCQLSNGRQIFPARSLAFQTAVVYVFFVKRLQIGLEAGQEQPFLPPFPGSPPPLHLHFWNLFHYQTAEA